MKYLNPFKKNVVKMILSSVLIIGFLGISYVPNSDIPRVHAQRAVVVVEDTSSSAVGTFLKSIVTAGASVASSISIGSLATKEFTLDGIAFALINMMLQQMSQSIITWINSGFEGSPSFMQDLGGFLTGVADRVAGDYIWGSDLNFLCSPFRLDIRFALDFQYRETRNFQPKCTLSGVVANMDRFIEGDFLSGGWDGWFEMTQSAVNNPYGALLVAEEEFSVRLRNAKGQELKYLDFNKGFLSVRDSLGNVLTPGTAIEAQLNATLDSGRQRIQVADEINEIIAALFSQLAKQAFSGVGGLLGLTQSGYGGGSGTYYNSLAREAAGATLSRNPIQNSITTETTYKTIHQTIVTSIQQAAIYEVGDCKAGPLSADLQNKLTISSVAVQTASNTIAILNSLLTQYNAAVGSPTAAADQSAIMERYLSLQATGVVHADVELFELREITLRDAQTAINTFLAGVEQACRYSDSGGRGGIN